MGGLAGLQLFEAADRLRVVVRRTIRVSSPRSLVIARGQDYREAFADIKDHRADHASHPYDRMLRTPGLL